MGGNWDLFITDKSRQVLVSDYPFHDISTIGRIILGVDSLVGNIKGSLEWEGTELAPELPKD